MSTHQGFFTDSTRREDQGIPPTGASPTYNYGNQPTGGNAYQRHYGSTPASQIPDYYNRRGKTNPGNMMHPWTPGRQTLFPLRNNYATDAEYMRAVQNWQSTAGRAMGSGAWQQGLSKYGLTPRITTPSPYVGGGGGGGGAGASGPRPSATAGSTLIPLSPEDAYRLREMGIAANTAFGLQESEIDRAEREAIAQLMQGYRAGARSARGQMIDVAGAAGEAGIGRSPAIAGLMQSDLDTELARLVSQQNQGIVQTDIESALQRAQNTAILQEALRRMERERTMLQTAAAMQSRGVAAPAKKKKKKGKAKSTTSTSTTPVLAEAE